MAERAKVVLMATPDQRKPVRSEHDEWGIASRRTEHNRTHGAGTLVWICVRTGLRRWQRPASMRESQVDVAVDAVLRSEYLVAAR